MGVGGSVGTAVVLKKKKTTKLQMCSYMKKDPRLAHMAQKGQSIIKKLNNWPQY